MAYDINAISGLTTPAQPAPPPEALTPAVAPPQVGGPSAPDTGLNLATPPAPPQRWHGNRNSESSGPAQ
jgi:hypothetical protein